MPTVYSITYVQMIRIPSIRSATAAPLFHRALDARATLPPVRDYHHPPPSHYLVRDARVPKKRSRDERPAQPLASGLDGVVQEQAGFVEAIKRPSELLVDGLGQRVRRHVPHAAVAPLKGGLKQRVPGG